MLKSAKMPSATEVLRHFRYTFENVAKVQELEKGKSLLEIAHRGDTSIGYRSLLMAFRLIHKDDISQTNHERIDNAIANLTELIRDTRNKRPTPHIFANPKDYATKTIEFLKEKEFSDKGYRSIFIVLSGSKHRMIAEVKEYVNGELSVRIYNGGKYCNPIEEEGAKEKKAVIFKVATERKIESPEYLNLFLQDVLLFKKGDKEVEKRMAEFLRDEISEINFTEGIPQHTGNCQSNSVNLMINECIGCDDEGIALSVNIRHFIESKSRKKIVSQIEEIEKSSVEESKSIKGNISVKKVAGVLGKGSENVMFLS